MARASSDLIHFPAAMLGGLVAVYSRVAVNASSAKFLRESAAPQAPTVWISWHEGNLIALALHRFVAGRSAMAFVPLVCREVP